LFRSEVTSLLFTSAIFDGVCPMNKLREIYYKLYEMYGPQGWWPVIDLEKEKSIYGKGAPRNDSEIFEICIGAILTQN